MFRKLTAALALAALILSAAACSGAPGLPRDDISGPEQDSATSGGEGARQTGTTAPPPDSQPDAGATTGRTAGSIGGTEPAPSTGCPAVLSLDSRGVEALLFRNLTSTPSAGAGQKEITDQAMVRRILDRIAAAPLTQTAAEPVPGTVLTLSGGDLCLSLQHGDVLWCRGRAYQADASLRRDLLALYRQAAEPEQTVTFDTEPGGNG